MSLDADRLVPDSDAKPQLDRALGDVGIEALPFIPKFSGDLDADTPLIAKLLPWMSPYDIHRRLLGRENQHKLPLRRLFYRAVQLAKSDPSLLDPKTPPDLVPADLRDLHSVRVDIREAVADGLRLSDLLRELMNEELPIYSVASYYQLIRLASAPSAAPSAPLTPHHRLAETVRVVDAIERERPGLRRFFASARSRKHAAEHAALTSTIELVAAIRTGVNIPDALRWAVENAYWGESEFIAPHQALLVRLVAAYCVGKPSLLSKEINRSPLGVPPALLSQLFVAHEVAVALMYDGSAAFTLEKMAGCRMFTRDVSSYVTETIPAKHRMLVQTLGHHLGDHPIPDLTADLHHISRGALAHVGLSALAMGDRHMWDWILQVTRPTPTLSCRKRALSLLSDATEFTVFDLGGGVRYTVELP